MCEVVVGVFWVVVVKDVGEEQMWEFLYGAFHKNFVSRLWVADRFVYALLSLSPFFFLPLCANAVPSEALTNVGVVE